MSYSFETIDGKTLKASPNVDIPDWIDNIAFKEKVDRVFDLTTDANIVNQKHVVASRSNNNTAFTRDIAYTFNNQTLKNFAVVKLSSFLRKTKFAILNSEPTDNGITFDVTFENNPAQYKFSYNANEGKINNDKFFIVALNNDVNEYPFSEAGLEDSFNDVKEGFDSKKSYKVKVGNNNFTVMTRYEIIKRCNGSLKEATDLINKNIKEGNIVGVGSNEYASYYDMNMLFPDKREDFEKEASHTADFVENIGQTDINEKKTAERLGLEAISFLNDKLAKKMHIANIHNAKRTNNKLLANIDIINKDICHNLDIVFDLENEKICNVSSIREGNKKYNFEKFNNEFGKNDAKIASYTKNENNTYTNKHILSERNIVEELGKYISREHIGSIINSWRKKNLISDVDLNSFASKYSLNELLSKTENLDFLSDEEIKSVLAEKQKFGENNRFYKLAVKDNDTRMKVALYEQQEIIDNVSSFISQFLNDYNLELLSNSDVVIYFILDDIPNAIYGDIIYDDNDNIRDILCSVNNKKVSVASLKKMFEKSKLLKSYAKHNDTSKHFNIVISKSMIRNKLKDYLTDVAIDKLIDELRDKNILKDIANEKFASAHSFDDILNLCNEIPIDGLRENNISLASKNDLYKFDKQYIKNNDTRNNIIEAKLDNFATKVNDFLKKYLDKFYVDVIDKNNALIETNGMKIYASIIGNVDDIICDVHGKRISIAKLNDALNKSPLLKSYLGENEDSDYQKIIISKRMFENKLNDYLSSSEINALIGYLEDNNKLQKIAEDQYVSNSSFDDLIRDVKVSPDMKLKAKHLKLRDKNNNYRFDSININDNDTRNDKAINAFNDKIASIKEKINSILNCDVKVINDKDLVLDFDGRKLYAYIDGNNVICKVGSKEVELKDVSKAFEKSEVLKQYLLDNKYKVVGSYDSIYTEDELRKLFKDYVSDDNVDSFIAKLSDKEIIKSLGNNKFASKYSRDEILNEYKNKIDSTLRKKHLILSNKNDDKQFEVINVEDTGTRNPEEQLSKANYKKIIASQMPDDVEIEDFKDIDIKEKCVTAELHLFNKEKGISSRVIAQSDIDNAKLKNTRFFIGNKEINIKDAFVNTLLAKKINEMRNNENTKHDILISKEALKKHLKFLTDDSKLDDAINSWLELGHVKEAGNNQYASKYSLNELISMSKLKPYMEEVINDNLKHASKNNEMIPKSFHTNNFEAKTLASVKDGKTNDVFNEVKDKVLKLAENYVEKSIITKNKLSKISALLDKVTTSRQLDSIYKDLQRYNK